MCPSGPERGSAPAREYRCDCGTLFSRKDSFVTHRAFCDALAQERTRLCATTTTPLHHQFDHPQTPKPAASLFPFSWEIAPNNTIYTQNPNNNIKYEMLNHPSTSHFHLSNHAKSPPPNHAMSPHMSATTLLQKACSIGVVSSCFPPECHVAPRDLPTWQKNDHLTRDFLGLVPLHNHQYTAAGGQVEVNMNMHDKLKYTGCLESIVQPINDLERSGTSEMSSLPFYLDPS